MNIGEGAGILVLESLDHARRRGARVYAELAGHALACEAFHPTAPEPEGLDHRDRHRPGVVAAGEINADQVDHINAHWTATPQNDTAEARGFRRALVTRRCDVPVTSIKSMIGHCLGASGAVEAAVLALTVARGVIPPTIHHAETDDGVSGRDRGQRSQGNAGPLRGVDVAGVRRQRLRNRDAVSQSMR